MLDTTVAGGVKASHSPMDCIVAEAEEEASLPGEFVRENAKAVGVVSYVTDSPKSGLMYPCVLYVYDIELPEDMVPQPQDEEVAEFMLMSVEEVKEAILAEKFKRNCVLVMLDFFVRHGYMTQENERDYLEIVTKLRSVLPVPLTPER
jgi:8-oxo-dGTP pyrophosphatase MutT (NUDIX family)